MDFFIVDRTFHVTLPTFWAFGNLSYFDLGKKFTSSFVKSIEEKITLAASNFGNCISPSLILPELSPLGQAPSVGV